MSQRRKKRRVRSGSSNAARPPVVTTERPERRRGPAKELPSYASFWRRLAAWLIDAVLTTVLLLLLSRLLDRAGLGWFGDPVYDGAPRWLDAIFLGSPLGASWLVLAGRWLYVGGFLSSGWQATPGKRAMRIIVTDLEGGRISFARATARYFAEFLSWIFLIGYLIQPFTARRQALHDLIAGTIVIRTPPS